MNHDPITEGRRLLDAATPGPWEAFGTSAGMVLDHCNCAGEQPYGHEQYCGVEGPVLQAAEPDIAWIVWARNNLPAILDRLAHWATILDAGATVLEHNATMLEHLTMDTPADQALTDEAVAGTRRAAHAMRAALNRDRT